ncbi:MAG: 50S ribosomal protein L19e [Candidatus Pacearchaeota archaeon]
MNLRKKKELVKKTFGVGKDRIIFLESRLNDIKEAITKQDIRDLYKDGAIIIKSVKGRRKVIKKHKKKGVGKIRKKIKDRKRRYVLLVRKLRKYLSNLKREGKISKEDIKKLRKKIRNKEFKSKAQLKEYIEGIKV